MRHVSDEIERDDPFLSACRGGRGRWTPVWFMRQAGRSLPEYRALREKHSMLEMCSTPELAAEATLQPVDRLGVDAAILFSDIVVTLVGMGVSLDIEPGVGPVIHEPLRTHADLERLRPLIPEEGTPYVPEAVRLVVRETKVPVIGFAGAPFTLASYLVEGGPSRHHERTKALMHGAPELWEALMERLAASVLAYLQAQLQAGAAAVQLFDSWAGTLSPHDYERYALPATRSILGGLEEFGAPRIHFGVTTGELLGLMAEAGADVVGVDWRVPLDDARSRVNGRAVQGNLDPALALAPWEVIGAEVADILKRGGGSGHIFNLGHGVLPDTDPEVLRRIVDDVHERTEGGSA
jgi:uroporphyrinogen decarboxylase